MSKYQQKITAKLAEAADLDKQIKKGKLKGKKLQWAKQRSYGLKRAAMMFSKRSDKPVQVKLSAKAVKAGLDTAEAAVKQRNKVATFDVKQGILPHFLEQLSVPRVEEMVSRLIFEALRKGLEAQQPRQERKLKAI